MAASIRAQPTARPAYPAHCTAGPAAPADVPEKVKLYIKANVAAWIKTPEATATGALALNPLFERLLDSQELRGF